MIAPPPTRPRQAAAVVMFRGSGEGLELFWVRRDRQLKFAGGFYAFPGGATDPGDALVPVQGLFGEQALLRATAARELFEETGVLLARGAEKLGPEELSRLRALLLEGKLGLGEVLSQHSLSLAGEDFLDAGRWVTPEFMPTRFDAQFFLVEAPAGASAEIWPGELAEGSWIRPVKAIERWEEGKVLLHPPALHALRVMAGFTSAAQASVQLTRLPHAENAEATRIEFQRGIRIFPLRTPTLPPATHTNAYVLGNGELLIVDPGASEEKEYGRLLAMVQALVEEGMKVKALVLTHHHWDHVGGAGPLKERLRIPLWCHAQTAQRLEVAVERKLEDGEVLKLEGAPPMEFRVLHTPGHAHGHLCLVHEPSKAAIVGDMVAGIGTVVIDPDDGDMADYLAQVERLRTLPVGTLYPAHGPIIPDGPGKLSEYLEHRALREGLVLAAVPPQGASLAELVKGAYQDVPPEVHPLAERSAEAILIKLEREGKVTRREGRYVPGK